MEALYAIFSWGSPLGTSLFLFFMGSGAGIFFWGLSKLKEADNKKK